MTEFREFSFKYLPLLIIVLFSFTQFLLILRHKSPFLSDSYFYQHQFYLFQGKSQQEAYLKVKSQVTADKTDTITSNIFSNINTYQNSYSFFSKRPFYPYLAFVINLVLRNEYLSFLIPVLLAYLGLILLIFYLIKNSLPYFYAVFATGLFVAFYPFLDYSTYFLTDTIGSFFWFLLLMITYKAFISKDNRLTSIYAVTFSLALFNREQIILFIPLLVIVYISLYKFKFPKQLRFKCLSLLVISFIISFFYLTVSYFTSQKNLLDTINYTQNSYGLYQHEFSLFQSFTYLVSSTINSHRVLIKDLTQHHWWFTFTILGAIGALKLLLAKKETNPINVLMFASMVSSYLFIFIFPDFSYRYYYPLIIGIIYFSSKTIWAYFKLVRL